MTIHIQPTADLAAQHPRSPWLAMARGLRGRCPACGNGRLYTAYLKVAHTCPACTAELHHQRADDAPPYFTMLIVGHVVIGGVLALERSLAPSMLVHMLIWLPLTLGLSLFLLPPIKGALIGLQWALRMHGFGPGPDPADPAPLPANTIASIDVERGR